MIRRAKPLLGTLVDISIVDQKPYVSSALEAAFTSIEKLQNCLSFHFEESDLNRINAATANTSIQVSEDLVKILSVCLDLNVRSGGVFNPAIAPILQRFNILPQFKFSAATHLSLLSDAFEIQSSDRILIKKSICLDLGGIAKGYAVDQACSVLQDFGIENAIVNAGGDLKAIGQQIHKIDIRYPNNLGSSGFSLAIQEQALATSAQYHFSDTSVHIDGRNGTVYSGQESISIKAKDCMYADALCKIAFFLSDDNLEPLLEYYNAEMFVISRNQMNINSADLLDEAGEKNAAQ